ncbi:hypothetical protein RO3G_09758 [Lichtheimia corymbifera JMRC:FSU:9682]|uniref:Uncharacterized protein n=1 Tax=Lichtheimia corymbifera JMRC:FSU:9682 TaxID=1263082 RepID=A0A068RIE7_9FUNG|nr:hypothetical protein RO3G_09758 [Lichtheimia corymbifera JMRC:FSU:9682]
MPEDKPSFISQVNAINDTEQLRHMLFEKERERASLANDLDVAAQLGLVVSETNEALQLKLAYLEQENDMLRQELSQIHPSTDSTTSYNTSTSIHTRDATTSPPPDDDATYTYDTHNTLNELDDRIHLTQELNQARKELTKFRKEMDGLSAQLNDMASEMVDSRARVSMYAKRLAEVEHKLATTREMNANLQAVLEKALTSQKQSSSNTSHLVRNIQVDLSRVVSENDQLRARIADLEGQQIESEEQLAMMVAQAKKYSALLEQAQDTIHSLSEPRLSDDDTLSNGAGSVSSYWDGGKETEITKGPVFSAEFRQEMQKEIERNLNLRNEIRHRIITHESISSDKKKTKEGLKYLLSERSSDAGLMSLSTSTSTTSSTMTMKQPQQTDDDHSQQQQQQQQPSSQHRPTQQHPTPITATMNTLRPASFLTGFGGFDNMGSGLGTTTNFITRGVPTAFTAPRGTGDTPSISTRFFQRLATRFDQQNDKKGR